MQEQEFEKQKQFLLSKLPDYLKSKGINVNSNFFCLNPTDTAHIPSMSYDASNYTVKCFNCNAVYNIFDLIGIDFNISDFSHQFIKAHELYIGKVPLGFIDVLKNYNNQKQSEIRTTTFEIENNNFLASHSSQKEVRVPFGFNENHNNDQFDQNLQQQQTQPQRGFNTISPFDEAKLKPFNLRGNAPSNSNTQTFGNNSFGQQQNSFGQQNLNNQNQFSSAQNQFAFNEQQNISHRFGDSQVSPFAYASESANDFTDYVNQCASNVEKTSYFRDRGLSDSVIHRFKLGFDENFQAEINKITGQKSYWKAAIIPYGIHGYCVRNTDLSANCSNERYKKKGIFDIYNHEALEQKGTIFITEGEFDALSLETLGYRAIALGGAGNVRPLIECIKDSTEEHTFYISLDNDEAGREATAKICTYLHQLGISFKCLNLAHPFKDINEALYSDKVMLKERLSNLDKILSYQFEDICAPTAYKYICAPEDLNTLELSSALYSFSARPQVLRRFVSQIIKTKLSSIVYAGNRVQWKYISNLVAEQQQPFDASQWQLVKFLELKDSDIEKQLIDGIESQTIQGNTNFVAMLDLCAYSQQETLALLDKLSSEVKSIGIPIIVLCNKADRDYVEGLSFQNIDIDVQPNGDFICNTIDKNGVPLSFIKCIGI